jgi:hypothetical protein
MNLGCSQTQERNPFTKRCVTKCKKGWERVKNTTKKKFLCYKVCKKGLLRNKKTNRCKKSPASYYTPPSRSLSSKYYTPHSKSRSLEYFYDNKSSPLEYSNEMRRRPSSTRSSRSLEYFYDNNSPELEGRPSTRSSNRSLEYFYDKKSPDFSYTNEMRIR